MGTRLGAPALAALLFYTPAIAEEAHRLANSKELGVEIDAMGGEGWCRQRLSLTFHAKDATVYPTAEFANLLKKLKQVLETECPQAQHADLRGLDANGTWVHHGSISFSNGELVSQREDEARPSSNSDGTDWGAMFAGWLNTILGWASALRP
tara:strand:+ start:212 stop:667 length:456 start_codon:yes stop_codon:yes gene_type:complete